MKNTITIGRHPPLGEVIDYYTREDFLAFMLDMLTRHRVVIVIPRTLYWEPDWEHDEVNNVILSAAEGSKDVDDLRRFIMGKITAAFPDMSRDMRPDYYSSFHQSVWQRVPSATEGNRARGKDCVFEADLPTWRGGPPRRRARQRPCEDPAEHGALPGAHRYSMRWTRSPDRCHQTRHFADAR